jgi:hypothetical protein
VIERVLAALAWFLWALILTSGLLLMTGCSLMPNRIHVAQVHMSQPLRGYAPYPLGGDDQPETTYEATEIGARWERKHAFAETSLGYVWHATYWEGGDVVFTGKVGMQWGLRK